MTTISSLIDLLRERFAQQFEIKYSYPNLYLLCIDERFAGMDLDQRQSLLARNIDVPVDSVRHLVSRGTVQLILISQEERAEYDHLDAASEGDHWLSWFGLRQARKPSEALSEGRVRALHFYGFKGGQARSTLLLLLAKKLADEGARVLLVDADVEAPSLDSMLDVATDDPSATLMGLCGWSDKTCPISRTYVGQPSSGTVDLVACRPRSPDFNVDYASFLLGAALDARLLQRAAARLREHCDASTQKYQFVLFDHRTGLSPSVLPLMQGWPGSVVIFLRPDGMSRNADISSALRALLSHESDAPGAFVSFSLDPKETVESQFAAHGKYIEKHLEVLSEAFSEDVTDKEQLIDPAELERYWILWRHDATLTSNCAPSPSELATVNSEAISQLRQVLGLSEVVGEEVAPSDPALTRSGATDEGAFILTPDVARLFSKDSSILYVFGRKGTGKTRLLRELHRQGLGEPLLVARDYQDAGLQSGSAKFNQLLEACSGDYERFWWELLRIKLVSDPNSPLELPDYSGKASVGFASAALTSKWIESEANSAVQPRRRVFLIDGVETAVPAARMREFVESLFRFLATVQYNRSISSILTVRLFLRSDLHRAATQNIEQQVEGTSLSLRWDRKSILNFALARLASLRWFKAKFSSVCEKIRARASEISRGAVDEREAEALLLEVFPRALERNKVKTTTFLATYFSDAGGESESRASFYPRLFDVFLREIDRAGQSNEKASASAISAEGRLQSYLVLRAYDAAATEFMNEVKSELYNLLDLVPGDSPNRDAIERLIEAFSGLKTPFETEALAQQVADRASLEADRVRESLQRMKQLGMFEDRPGFPGWWRTGRLYKTGLNMKYVRG